MTRKSNSGSGDSRGWVTVEGAGEMLGVGRTTAYRLVRDGNWPTPVIYLGKQIRIPLQPLLDLLAGTSSASA
jgi:excisionase family DNA binding protein